MASSKAAVTKMDEDEAAKLEAQASQIAEGLLKMGPSVNERTQALCLAIKDVQYDKLTVLSMTLVAAGHAKLTQMPKSTFLMVAGIYYDSAESLMVPASQAILQ